MMSKRTVQPSPKTPIKFELSMKHREISIEFELLVNPKGSIGCVKEMLMFFIPFQQMQNILSIQAPEKNLDLVINLETPPSFFKRLDDFRADGDNARLWTERDVWYRQTDIVHPPGRFKNSAITLKKAKPILDLGASTMTRSQAL